MWQDSVGKTDTEMTIPQIVLGHPGNLAEDQEPGNSFPCQLTLELRSVKEWELVS